MKEKIMIELTMASCDSNPNPKTKIQLLQENKTVEVKNHRQKYFYRINLPNVYLTSTSE